MTALLAAVLGATVGLGAWLTVMGLAGQSIFGERLSTSGGFENDEALRAKVIVAVVSGVSIGIATQWVAMAFLVVVGVLLLWGRLGSKKQMIRLTEKAEAIAGWTEQVSGAIRSGMHVNAAIRAAADHAHSSIARPARNLARNIETMSLADAIIRFSAEVDHPAADGVCASIALSEQHGSSRLTDMLQIQTIQTRDQVRMMTEVAATRAQVRVSTRGMIGLSVSMAILLRFFAADFLAFYNSAFGQVVMLLVGGIFLMALWLLANLLKNKPLPRYFTGLGEVSVS